jgi:hypothetical protein
MGAEFRSDQIDRFLPVWRILSRKAERSDRIGRRASIAEYACARLAADGNCLMPLDGIDVVWNGIRHRSRLRVKRSTHN